MAVFIIPTRTDLENYSIEIELDSVFFIFKFAWNVREDKWFLTISSSAGVEIASGIKIVVDYDLLQSVSNADKPEGDLIAVDYSRNGLDPGVNDLGDRVLLMYNEAS